MQDFEVISGFVRPILEKYADPIINGVAGIVKDEWEKFKIDFDIVFKRYLENATAKYSRVKTILYKTEPKYIYDFFECPFLTKERGTFIKGDDINNLLAISNFVIIQGTGGIGKSTFFKHLFLNEIERKDLIPIFVELKDINSYSDDFDILNFVFQKLNTLGSTIDYKYLDYALKSGCFLFLLDGYDEILGEKKDDFLSKLESFCDKYSNNCYILSSRPYSDFVEFQRFSVLTLCPLTKQQAVSLIQKIEYDEDIKKRFVNDLQSNLYKTHESFASNPLLLNIMLLTYDNYAEIPQKQHLFYSNAFDTLYFKHDATKAGFHRELQSNLSADSFKRVFAFFCFSTYFQGKIEFTYAEIVMVLKKIRKSTEFFDIDKYLYDLVNSICVLCKEGLNYKFTHRSFQEYFAAIFLKELPDNDMQRMAIQLIKKDTYRVANDSVLPMLKDMAQHRFEQNIILPLLEEVEVSCTSEDKYDFYLTTRAPHLSFCARSKETPYQLYLRTTFDMDLPTFLFEIARQYVEYDTLKKEECDEVAQNLFELLVNKRSLKPGQGFSALDYCNDREVHMLIRKTWVGVIIEKLACLRDYLEKKRSDAELDLSGLLID